MKYYFYLDSNNVQQGPFPAETLTAKGVNLNTLVWTEGMAEWAPASSLPELSMIMQGNAASAMPNSAPQRDYSNSNYQKDERTIVQPQQPAYQAPQQPAYQAPQQPAYQAPQQPAYQAPQQPAYQAPQQPAYQAPQQPAYQAPQQPAYQAAQQPAGAYPGMQQPTVNISVGQTPQQAPFPKPNNGLVLGILCLLFCCLPFGIFSVVKASQVDKLYASGDYYGAKEAASTAKKLAIWGAVAGFVFYVVYIIAMVSGSMASMNYF